MTKSIELCPPDEPFPDVVQPTATRRLVAILPSETNSIFSCNQQPCIGYMHRSGTNTINQTLYNTERHLLPRIQRCLVRVKQNFLFCGTIQRRGYSSGRRRPSIVCSADDHCDLIYIRCFIRIKVIEIHQAHFIWVLMKQKNYHTRNTLCHKKRSSVWDTPRFCSNHETTLNIVGVICLIKTHLQNRVIRDQIWI